jgi:hypothetical protein
MISKTRPLVLGAIFWIFLYAAPQLAWGGNVDLPDESTPIKLDAATLNWGAIALKEFQSTHKDWRCFSVSMYFSASNWRIDFLPKDDVRDSGKDLIVGDSKCGRGMSFIIGKNGRIVQRIYSR